jgi:hypothetical protein
VCLVTAPLQHYKIPPIKLSKKMSNFGIKSNTMSATIETLREKLHQYIDHVEDKKIKAFYTIVQTDIEEDETIYTLEFKSELDKRQEDYKSGKSKMVTSEESKKRIQKILKNKFNK